LVAQKRIGKLIERSQSCFKLQAAHIDCAPLTKVVPVLEWLETLGQILAWSALVLAWDHQLFLAASKLVFVLRARALVSRLFRWAILHRFGFLLARPVLVSAGSLVAVAVAVVVAVLVAVAVVPVVAVLMVLSVWLAVSQIFLRLLQLMVRSAGVHVELAVSFTWRQAGRLQIELELVTKLDRLSKLVH